MRFQDYMWFMQLEPDVMPLKGNWVQKIYQETLDMKGNFWFKGSVHRSRVVPDSHINGNAIYRLGDQCFNLWLQQCSDIWFARTAFDSSLNACEDNFVTIGRAVSKHKINFNDFMSE